MLLPFCIGMSYEEFWYKDVELVVFYRKAHEIRTRRENEMMWTQGVYYLKALEATVGNLFLKKGARPNEYPKAPFPITEQEHRELKAKEEALKQERMKAEFACFVARIAQKMPNT